MEKIINPYRKFNVIVIPEGIAKIPVKELSDAAKLCYGRLLRYAGKNGYCYPGITALAKEIGHKRRSGDKYIKELLDFGLIKNKRRGLNKTNLYFFLNHPVLQSAVIDNSSNAEMNASDMSDSTNKESQYKESQYNEIKTLYNPDGSVCVSEVQEDKLVPLDKSKNGEKNNLNQDLKDIVSAYRSKISKSYPPQVTCETPGLIKLALGHFSKEQILEGIDRYSKNLWHMDHTAQHGIDWYFKYNFELDCPWYLEDFLYLGENKLKDLELAKFTEFWLAYPKKEGEFTAKEFWLDNQLGDFLPVILSFIENAKQTERWIKGYIKSPLKFLSEKSWNDNLAEYGISKMPTNKINSIYYNKGATEQGVIIIKNK